MKLLLKQLVACAAALTSCISTVAQMNPIVQSVMQLTRETSKASNQLFNMEAAGFAMTTEQGNSYEPAWQKPLDTAIGYSHFGVETSFIQTSDGNYVQYSTNGDGSSVLAAYLKKISATGEEIWRVKINPERVTRAGRVIETPNGNLYVSGTTKKEGLLRQFIAVYDSKGNELTTNILPGEFLELQPGFVANWKDGKVAVVFRGKDMTNTPYFYSYIMESSDNPVFRGKSNAGMNNNVYDVNDAYVLGDYIVFVNSRAYYWWNLNDDSDLALKSGAYQDSARNGNSVCLASDANKHIVITRIAAGENGIEEIWSTTLTLTSSYYDAVISCDAEENTYVTRQKELSSFAMVSPEGEELWVYNDVEFGDNGVNKGGCYGMGVDNEGNYILVGHEGEEWRVWIAKMSKENFSKISLEKFVIDDNYLYAYTFQNNNIIGNDNIVICGHLRDAYVNENSGDVQYLAKFNLNGNNNLVWKNLSESLTVPIVSPIDIVADNEDNAYLIESNLNDLQRISKYSADGQLLWSNSLPVENATAVHATDIALLSNGNVVVAGYTTNENVTDYLKYYGTFLACYSTAGQLIWTNQNLAIDQYYCMGYTNMVIDYNDNIYLMSDGIDVNWSKFGLLFKVNASGTLVNTGTVSSENNMSITGLYTTADGHLLVSGSYPNDNWNQCISLSKYNSKLEKVFETCIDKGVNMVLTDCSSDSKGNTWIVGFTDENKGYWTMLNPTGATAYEASPDDDCQYTGIKVVKDEVIVFGIGRNSNNIRCGIARAIDTEGNVKWTSELSDGTLATYIYKALDGDKLIFSGFSIDSDINYYDILIELNDDGTTANLNKTILHMDRDLYSFNDFAYVGLANGNNSVFTIYDFSPCTNLSQGVINCFQLKNADIKEINIGDDNSSINIKVLDDMLIADTSSNVKITVYDIAGRMLKTVNGNVMNISSLSKGIYVATISTTSSRKSLRFIK